MGRHQEQSPEVITRAVLRRDREDRFRREWSELELAKAVAFYLSAIAVGVALAAVLGVL